MTYKNYLLFATSLLSIFGLAASEGKEKAMSKEAFRKMLITYAYIKVKDAQETPLYIAARTGNKAAMRALLNASANREPRNTV